MTIALTTRAALLALLITPLGGRAQSQTYVTPPYGASVPNYQSRSDYYRDHPRQDPEPFRCNYAADSTCPGGRPSGYQGDPRDDPEPFRCTYSSGAECGGDRGGLNRPR